MGTPLGEGLGQGIAVLVDETEATIRYVRAYGADDVRVAAGAPLEIARDLFDAGKHAVTRLFKKEKPGPLTTDTFLGRT